MPREYPRKLRVAAELKRMLSSLLSTEVKEPRLEGVRVTDVEVSGDLSVAKVFFSTLDPDEDPAAAREAFDGAMGFLRARVGRALRVRRVPELRFVHDASAKQGLELSRLIEETAPREDSENGSSGDQTV